MTSDELKQMTDGLVERLRADAGFDGQKLLAADALTAYQSLTARLISQNAAQEVLIGEHIAKQREAEARAAWQPIETAPKTGRTLLLGYSNVLGNWRTVRGQWISEAYIEQNWEEPDDAEAGWYETSVEADDVPNCWPISPTHWMPLPRAPIAATEGEES
ncbi:MAG TPA: hypothetical protein VF534_17895 [Paraburkholderia sp.]